MHYADVDLGLASLGTNRRENFFVMDFPAARLNAHVLNVVFSRRSRLHLHFDDVFPLKVGTGLTKCCTCRPLFSTHAKT